MPTANEAILATDCNDLRRALEAERTCNRNQRDAITRLNAKLVSQAQEIDRLTRALAKAQAETAELHKRLAGELPY
jgi:septal ring factor EnvC (AmiA/AmiB activator)